MVKPQLEYANDFWDAYHVEDIVELEKVQRRAAHWVMNDYGRYSSITSMLEQLSRPTLQFHRKSSRLQTLHKVATIPSNITYNSSILLTNIMFYKTVPPITLHLTTYQYSYFYRTMNDWNKVPVNLIELTDTDSFKNDLQSLL